MSDLKTSLLINRQVPEFVREEYPKFLTFLEAYFEFLDNTVYGKAKQLRNIKDVDETLDEFEQNFFNDFLPFLPKNTALNKETLIKNILPLYLAKGSEKSYQLLFRMLFDEETKLEYPGDNILRASDGKWLKEDALRVELDGITSIFVSDGVKKSYYLPFEAEAQDFVLYKKVSGNTNYELINSGFTLQKQFRRIDFNEPLANNTTLKIEYTNFDINCVENRKITGKLSSSYSIIERAYRRTVGNQSYYQLIINPKNTIGNFFFGESLQTDVIFNDELIPIEFFSYSDLESIQITNGGSSYNVGDPVTVRAPSILPAYAIVSKIVTGFIENLSVLDGGAGYRAFNDITANAVSNSIFLAKVSSVDASGQLSSNTITFNTDVIANAVDLVIASNNYNFPANSSANLNSIISSALANATIGTLGSIATVNVITSFIKSSPMPQFIIEDNYLFSNTQFSTLSIQDLHSIGSLEIVNRGQNYQVGEYLIFTNTPQSFSGQGANAVISSVLANGSINTIEIKNGGLNYEKLYPPTITINSANGSGALIEVKHLMGSGAGLDVVVGTEPEGKILDIRIIDPGKGFLLTPEIDLTNYGDGKATAVANISSSFVNLAGRWKTSDGIISNDLVKLQGQDYYIDYSYVTSSRVEFQKYKDVVKKLLHPAGFVNYSKYKFDENIQTSHNFASNSYVNLTTSGRVNLNSSIYIVGTSTKFLVANSLGILSPGDKIAINTQTRIVNTIISNTVITTTNAFSISSNSEIIKIIT